MKPIPKTITNRRALAGLIAIPLLIGAIGVEKLHAQTWYASNHFALYNAPDTSLISDKFQVKIRKSGTTDAFVAGNVLISQLDATYAAQSQPPSNTFLTVDTKYYSNLWGCSHSYLNFEMKSAVDVEVKLSNNGDIDDKITTIRPASKVSRVKVSADKKTLSFTMSNPCNVAVDINGVMANRLPDTNSLPAVHTLSIHGNPVMAGKPATNGANVTTVTPGTAPSTATLNTFNSGAGPKTLYFLPGIHNLGENFKVHPNRTYYIPGDAIVYGTFNNINDPGPTQTLSPLHVAQSITIMGHGTISGKNINHWEMAKVQVNLSGAVIAPSLYTVLNSDKDNRTPPYIEQERISYRKSAIELKECKGTRIEGITIVDPANHSFRNETTTYTGIDDQNEVAWVKIFAWRANSDGAGINDSSIVHDCFYRVQDDGFYPRGIALRDCVLWSDANGVPFRLSALNQLKRAEMLKHNQTDHLRVEDMEVIFRRNMSWSNSPSIELPTLDGGVRDRRFVFSNIKLLDQSTNRIPIDIQQAKPGSISNILFENVTVAKMPTTPNRVKNLLWAGESASVRDIQFHNLVIGGNVVNADNWTNYFTTARPFDDEGKLLPSPQDSISPVENITFTNSLITGWTASGSAGSSGASNAIDLNISNRWTTEAVQSASHWFRLTNANSKVFDRIILDCNANPADFPRGYEVYVSNASTAPDPTTGDWGTAVATGSGSNATTVIDFTRQRAKHILIKQTGVTSFNWWSINEVYVFESDALNPAGWTVLAGAPATMSAQPAPVFDGRTNTRWPTKDNGIYQASNSQVFQVDMKNQKNFDRILMDSTGYTGDHPRGYVVKVSNDATNWTTVATGAGFGFKTMVTMLPQTAQHIRVEQTGTAPDNWWSISEFNVYKPRVNTAPLTTPWVTTLIGGAAGSILPIKDSSSTRWSTTILSGDIGTPSDSFGFAYKSASTENRTISANINSLEGSREWAKSGLMIRQSTQANANHVFFGFGANGTLQMSQRGGSIVGPMNSTLNVTITGTTSSTANPTSTGRFIKLEKLANQIKGYSSPSGAAGTWTHLATCSLNLTGSYVSGIACSSQNESTPYTDYALSGVTDVINN